MKKAVFFITYTALLIASTRFEAKGQNLQDGGYIKGYKEYITFFKKIDDSVTPPLSHKEYKEKYLYCSLHQTNLHTTKVKTVFGDKIAVSHKPWERGLKRYALAPYAKYLVNVIEKDKTRQKTYYCTGCEKMYKVFLKLIRMVPGNKLDLEFLNKELYQAYRN